MASICHFGSETMKKHCHCGGGAGQLAAKSFSHPNNNEQQSGTARKINRAFCLILWSGLRWPNKSTRNNESTELTCLLAI